MVIATLRLPMFHNRVKYVWIVFQYFFSFSDLILHFFHCSLIFLFTLPKIAPFISCISGDLWLTTSAVLWQTRPTNIRGFILWLYYFYLHGFLRTFTPTPDKIFTCNAFRKTLFVTDTTRSARASVYLTLSHTHTMFFAPVSYSLSFSDTKYLSLQCFTYDLVQEFSGKTKIKLLQEIKIAWTTWPSVVSDPITLCFSEIH